MTGGMLRIINVMVTCRHTLHSCGLLGYPGNFPRARTSSDSSRVAPCRTTPPICLCAGYMYGIHDALVDVYIVQTSNRGSKSGMQPWMIGNMHGACAKKQAPLQAADDPRSSRNHAACRRSWLMAPGRCLAEAAAAGLFGCEWPGGHLGGV